MQNADTLLMIRPVHFTFNAETAKNNYFQKEDSAENIQELALKEFDTLVAKLRAKGIEVVVMEDTLDPHTPDSIYPNNWISLQSDGVITLYPMFAQNRRWERRKDIIDTIRKDFLVKEVVDLSGFEKEDRYLEGTGSMIFDHDNKIAYGCVSLRLDEELFRNYCRRFGYTPIVFHAFHTVNGERLPIYHTNVMMSVAKDFVVICLAAIDDEEEQKRVIQTIVDSGKEIVDISEEQMHQFLGNMLQMKNKAGDSFMVMSEAAYKSLVYSQKIYIEKYSEIIYSDLQTIETNGGGSARCMLAEIFLEPK